MKLKYYDGNGKWLVAGHDYYNKLYGENHLVNGKPLSEIGVRYKDDWWLVDPIEKLEVIKKSAGGIIGFKLIDEELASEKLPLKVNSDAFVEEDDGPYNEFARYQALYEAVYAEPSSAIENIDLDLTLLGKFNVSALEDISKPLVNKPKEVGKAEWVTDAIKAAATHDELTQVLIAAPLRHNYPCAISSQQLYKMIVSAIKSNLPSHAYISSDYSFCFDVKTRIKTQSEVFRKEKLTPRGNSYRPPRFENVRKDVREKSIFLASDGFIPLVSLSYKLRVLGSEGSLRILHLQY